ncbi:polysaccharide pyruvyl transferase family protein [Paenibacillus sp.]|uniref:polysaccharide pyruvyl transferase family protein n=1 Tax=Paenibacillus sp. TaxID=58172 RepID=UPI0028128442|nr:polysaccharide pyruvyl transferase family protein [Paenibacillus sp.]
MKICTITCHDVYNHGASLQAYGLMRYLINLGYEVEIIDYKPDYLSRHYKLFAISSPKWEKNLFTKLLYLGAKVPGRVVSLKRKRAFDAFKAKHLALTPARYNTNDELKRNPPEADIYLCGSDQIWNTLHRNGSDPAFYLDFVPEGKVRAAYAASFATESIHDRYKPFVKEKVSKLDGIGVREKSGVAILHQMQIHQAVNVVDPAFLLDDSEWNRLGTASIPGDYVLVYDFDDSSLIRRIAESLAKRWSCKIYAVNGGKSKYANKYFQYEGPETFVSLVRDAKFVISNSFHAAVFSIIYEKNFAIVNRTEAINTRMRDLLDDLGLLDRLVGEYVGIDELCRDIEYRKVKTILNRKIQESKGYLNTILGNRRKSS